MNDNRSARQVVVLIRGYPGVGKTTIAFAIARELKYCLICKDDVREAAIRHDAKVMSEIRAVCPQHVPSIRVDSNDMTYEAMFAVGVTQLRVGAPGIVLESPLGRVALGERALQITKEAQALCVLVDCYAEKAVWEERLAKRASQSQFRPTNVHQIESNYANIEYKIECDAHIRIDCGLPTAKNVKRVAQTIQQLLYDEGTIDRSPSME